MPTRIWFLPVNRFFCASSVSMKLGLSSHADTRVGRIRMQELPPSWWCRRSVVRYRPGAPARTLCPWVQPVSLCPASCVAKAPRASVAALCQWLRLASRGLKLEGCMGEGTKTETAAAHLWREACTGAVRPPESLTRRRVRTKRRFSPMRPACDPRDSAPRGGPLQRRRRPEPGTGGGGLPGGTRR